jgi:hypothetical protein
MARGKYEETIQFGWSRNEIQRQAELEAEALGIPYDDVLKRLEEESRRSGGGSAHGVQKEVAF